VSRPQKSGMDYFPHDCDASNDEKLEALRALYGNDGYAFYFILLERIYRSPHGELDISGPETRSVLIRKVGVAGELFDRMLASALKLGCFDMVAYENGVLTSDGVRRRVEAVEERRERMRERYGPKVSAAKTPVKTGQKRDRKPKWGPSVSGFATVFKYWNEVGPRVHKTATADMEHAYAKARERWSQDEIVGSIAHYGEVTRSPDRYWFNYKWTLVEFLTRKNAIEKFVDPVCLENFAHKKGGGNGREVITNDKIKQLADKARKLGAH
jgi:hypothetical protein